MTILDEPTEPGLYVAYVNPDVPVPYATKRLLMWHDNRWSYPASTQFYRGHVYGCIGPLPALKLDPQEPTDA